MRELKSGDARIGIRASNLTRTFFQQEFGTDLDKELEPLIDARMNSAKRMLAQMSQDELTAIASVKGLETMSAEKAVETVQQSGILENKALSSKLYGLALMDASLPVMSAMKIVWAMNAAQNFAEGVATPNFDAWVARYDEFNFNACMGDIIAECDKGFFR